VFTGASRPGKRYVAEDFVVGNPKVAADNWDGGVRFDDVQSEAQTKALIEKHPEVELVCTPYTASSKELAKNSLFDAVRKCDVKWAKVPAASE